MTANKGLSATVAGTGFAEPLDAGLDAAGIVLAVFRLLGRSEADAVASGRRA